MSMYAQREYLCAYQSGCIAPIGNVLIIGFLARPNLTHGTLIARVSLSRRNARVSLSRTYCYVRVMVSSAFSWFKSVNRTSLDNKTY